MQPMFDEKQLAAIAAMEEKTKIFTDLSDEIWGYAELSLYEHKSCAAYVKALTAAGFQVESPFCDLDTAFLARFGSGKPVIAILAEYDALSGLSQQGGKAERDPEPGMSNGHGCGHNLLGAGAFAAAYALKEYLAATGISGTVLLYGCPGEEGGASKTWFAKQNAYADVDVALTWHPDDVFEVTSGSTQACIQTEYRFKGIASHAAGDPEQGRSALDAVELMNIGVQYLREHMPTTARVHYAITDAGGPSPNVVQPHARVLYMVRDATVQGAVVLQKRVDAIAEGAAIMTETTMEKVFIDGLANVITNKTLEELLQTVYENTALPTYTEEEKAFFAALYETYEKVGLPGSAAKEDPEIAEQVQALTDNGARVINDFVQPYRFSMRPIPGSTDVGDVSWLVPTAQIHAACAPSRCPGHSWQNVAAYKSSAAHKGMMTAAKVLALTAMQLYSDPETIAAAKAEHAKRTAAGYVCPIPDGETIKPVEQV